MAPNSFGGPVENERFVEPPVPVGGDGARYDHREGNDDYTQAGNLFRLIGADAQARLIENIVEGMKGVPERVQVRQLVHFYRADPAYGQGVADGLGLTVDWAKWANLSLRELFAATAEGTYGVEQTETPPPSERAPA